MTRVVCSKETRTHFVVEEQQQAFLQSSKICGDEGPSPLPLPQALSQQEYLSAEVEKEEDRPEAGGQLHRPAAAEGQYTGAITSHTHGLAKQAMG